MSTSATLEHSLLGEIKMQEAALAYAPPRLRAVRQNAIRRFTEAGLPKRNDEAWRWTDLSPLRAEQSSPALFPSVDFNSMDGPPFANLDAWRLTFVNGVFQNDLSDLPSGVRAVSLRAALKDDPALAERLGDSAGSPFLLLNTALLNDGAFISVDRDTQVQKPLHLIFFNTGNAQIRNLLLLEPRAEVTLLESHYGPSGADYFVNQASDVHLGEGARLAHYRDQAESLKALHFHFLNARLGGKSIYDGFTLTRGAHLSRNEAHIEISGTGVHCSLNGVNMLTGSQIADTTCVMDHRAPGSRSNQMFRSVLDGKSQGVFQGLIRVAKPAQRTDARQQIKALLLSPHAVQNSKPELEILADDVKCAHGASVGQMDEAALFYLRARGIGEAQARALLIGAFLDDAVTQIQGSTALDAGKIQENIQATISKWLAQQLVVENV